VRGFKKINLQNETEREQTTMETVKASATPEEMKVICERAGLTPKRLAADRLKEQSSRVHAMRRVYARHPELVYEPLDVVGEALGNFRWDDWQLELAVGEWAVLFDGDPGHDVDVSYCIVLSVEPFRSVSILPALDREVRVFRHRGEPGGHVITVRACEFQAPLTGEQVERARAAGWPSTMAEFVKVL
jgi:hypothetical protein